MLLKSWGAKSLLFETYHLQEGQVPSPHIVKVDLHLGPVQLASHIEGLALAFVVHNGVVERQVSLSLVDAPPKLPRKEVHAHDAEDEPEDEADEQDVHDGGDGTQQGIHHHLVGNRKGPGAPGCHPTLLDPASFCAHSGCVKSQWPWQGKNVINNTETLSTRRWG